MPDKDKGIGCYCFKICDTQPDSAFLNEIDTTMVYIYGCHFPGSAGEKLKCNASGAAKQIQYAERFKIHHIIEYIEQGFPGKIGGRTDR